MDFKAAVVAEVERLAIRVGGSWEAVRMEYADQFGFEGSRARDLSAPQAMAFRDQLLRDLAVKEEEERNRQES